MPTERCRHFPKDAQKHSIPASGWKASKMRNSSYWIVGFCALALAARYPALASDTLTTLYLFDQSNLGPANPAAGIVPDTQGNLFGTTYYGGNDGCRNTGCGTIFEVSPAGGGQWTTKTLYTFLNDGDGEHPESPLEIDRDGALYGINGGDLSEGDIWRVAPASQGGTFQVIQRFAGKAGLYGLGPLAIRGRDIYGVTYASGTGCGGKGCGTLFELTPRGNDTWKLRTLFSSFPQADSLPVWIVPGKERGTFVVSTAQGNGAVVSLSQSGASWSLSELHAFAGNLDGKQPGNLVVGADGTIYGTAQTSNGGLVFALSPPATKGAAWTETVLHNFSPFPPSSLSISHDGTLAGVVFGDTDFEPGLVFTIAPTRTGTTWRYKTLYKFEIPGSPSVNPENLFKGTDGHYYGALNGGGINGGAIFELGN
jgi:uncharacterized repeat protein (TIGR03803 family)